MAGQYIVPLLGSERIVCIVAIALSNTNTLPEDTSELNTPVLVLWGERDTSLGPSSAANLQRLSNTRSKLLCDCDRVEIRYAYSFEFGNLFTLFAFVCPNLCCCNV